MKSLITITSLVAAAAMTTTAMAETITINTNTNNIANDKNVAGNLVDITANAAGYFAGWAGGTFLPDVQINENVTFTINNGGSTSYQQFSGAFKGSGRLTFNSGGPGQGEKFYFSGNMSQFTGIIRRDATTSYAEDGQGLLQFGGKDGAVDGAYAMSSGEITTTGAAVFNYYSGNVNMSQTNLNARTLVFKGGATYNLAATTVNGYSSNWNDTTFKVDAGTTVNLNTDLNVSATARFKIFNISGNLNVGAGKTLNLSDAAVTLASEITNAGTVTVNANTSFILNGLAAVNSVYTLVNGGTITNWDTLSTDKISGITLTRGQTLSFEEAGKVKVLGTDVYTWNGGASGTWGAENVWTFNSESKTWEAGKSAEITTAATIDVAEVTSATIVYVDENVTLNNQTNLTVTDHIALATGKTLTFSQGPVSKEVRGDNTTNVSVSLTSENWNADSTKIDLGDQFAGTTTVTAGHLTISNSNFGTGKIIIAGTTDFQSLATTSKANAIQFTGTTHNVYANSGCPITLTGDFTIDADATVKKQGAANLIINGGDITINGTMTQQAGTTSITVATGKTLTIGQNATATVESISNNGTIFLLSGSTLTVNGTLALAPSAKKTLNVAENAKVTATTYTNGWGQTITNNGIIEATTDFQTKTGNGANDTTFSGTGYIFAKKWTIGNQTNVTLSNNKMILGSGGIVKEANGQLTVNSTIGAYENWSSSMNMTLGATAIFDTAKYTLSEKTVARSDTEGLTITLSGILSGSNNLEKQGLGTLTLSGANTYSGGTTISAGTLVAANASALGSGVTVANGANLQVNVTGVTTSGAINFAEGAKLVLGNALLDGATGDTIALDIIAGSAISYNGATITAETVDSFVEYGSAFDSYNKTWQYSNGDLNLTLTAVPEPSMFGLLAGLGALALVGARRRRKTK